MIAPLPDLRGRFIHALTQFTHNVHNEHVTFSNIIAASGRNTFEACAVRASMGLHTKLSATRLGAILLVPGPVFSTERSDTTQQNAPEVAALEAQIADLKQLVALLQAQISDIREQKDKWQKRSRTDQPSLTVLM